MGAYALLVPEHACSPAGGLCSRCEPGRLASRGPAAPRLCARLSQGTGRSLRLRAAPIGGGCSELQSGVLSRIHFCSLQWRQNDPFQETAENRHPWDLTASSAWS